ncbi:MAG: bifunctional precorrin-2 dehydrogenase/sirohydrochlorin ferrochelatase [Methanomicrobium sp.]|nr:bifunctional precorrin-2 dehydrogenase/sirohydrochlorin ferrochelatase [Methanomicrobium sp.]
MIPLIHDMSGKKVVIFGGGEVGFRKASFFYPESDIYVVSRTFYKKFNSINITAIEKELNDAEDNFFLDIINESFLVVAATSDQNLNNHIGRLSKKAGILFNNADGNTGDVMIPSVISGKNYMIAISTCGKSPGMSRYIRKSLEERFPDLDEMISLQSEVRELLKKKEPVQKRRNEILRNIIYDEKVWEELKRDRNSALIYIQEKYFR